MLKVYQTSITIKSHLCNIIDFLLYFILGLRQPFLSPSELLFHLREALGLDAVADIVIELTKLVLLELALKT